MGGMIYTVPPISNKEHIKSKEIKNYEQRAKKETGTRTKKS